MTTIRSKEFVAPERIDVQPASALGLFAAQADRVGTVGPLLRTWNHLGE